MGGRCPSAHTGADEGATLYPTFPCRKKARSRLSPQRNFSSVPLGKSVAPSSVTFGDSFPPRGSLWAAQERGALFIGPGIPVYGGMVVGETPKSEDITVNVCRKKQLTNMRASGSDEALRLVPPRNLSLEQCLEFLADDELLEVTPKTLRLRKRILNHEIRMKALKGNKKYQNL